MFNQSFSRTKIVATIGPATQSKEMLEKIIEAGVDICRLNCSHGDHEVLKQVIKSVRELNLEHNLHTCCLADLQGPKIRLGEVENNQIFWERGMKVTFTTQKMIGTASRVYLSYPGFPTDVKVGETILVDDGKFELKVISSNLIDEVEAEVVYGGSISSKKGVNLPNTKISLPSLTEKDLIDLEFALEQEVEWIALSFVRTADDIIDLKNRIKAAGKSCKVIAKIEKPEAVDNFEEILKVTDAVMVARGDLGVELPMEELPIIQKMLVKKCVKASKPVIIATQMMESMIKSPKPTRAETNDVANAVLDGADAVMLSAETSVGDYPIEVIQQMEKIIQRMEKDKSLYSKFKFHLDVESKTYLSDAICYNAVMISKEVNADAIISMTKTGYTAFKISSHRPEAPIFIFSNDRELLNTMNLIWGVRGLYYDKFESTDETILDVIKILKNEGFISAGNVVVNTASMPIHEKTRTNAIKISIVE